MSELISFQYMNYYEVPNRPDQHSYDLNDLTSL